MSKLEELFESLRGGTKSALFAQNRLKRALVLWRKLKAWKNLRQKTEWLGQLRFVQ